MTFQCPYDKQREIIFFYFQRGDKYVNGYYKSKIVENPTWENTRLDSAKTAVHMYRLNVSHIGDYQCHIRYDDGPSETVIHLSLTGMSALNPTFKTVSDCLLIVSVSNTLQHYDGIILSVLYSKLRIR